MSQQEPTHNMPATCGHIGLHFLEPYRIPRYLKASFFRLAKKASQFFVSLSECDFLLACRPLEWLVNGIAIAIKVGQCVFIDAVNAEPMADILFSELQNHAPAKGIQNVLNFICRLELGLSNDINFRTEYGSNVLVAQRHTFFIFSHLHLFQIKLEIHKQKT
jgi:hypothetical protein